MSALDSLPDWAKEPNGALTTCEAVSYTRLSAARLAGLHREGRVRRVFLTKLSPLWSRADLAAYLERGRVVRRA